MYGDCDETRIRMFSRDKGVGQPLPYTVKLHIFREYVKLSTSIGYCPNSLPYQDNPLLLSIYWYGGDGETRTLIPLQVTGFQDQTDTNFWLRLHNGTPNQNRTGDARMKTVWLNRLPMGAYGGVGRT